MTWLVAVVSVIVVIVVRPILSQIAVLHISEFRCRGGGGAPFLLGTGGKGWKERNEGREKEGRKEGNSERQKDDEQSLSVVVIPTV